MGNVLYIVFNQIDHIHHSKGLTQGSNTYVMGCGTGCSCPGHAECGRDRRQQLPVHGRQADREQRQQLQPPRGTECGQLHHRPQLLKGPCASGRCLPDLLRLNLKSQRLQDIEKDLFHDSEMWTSRKRHVKDGQDLFKMRMCQE